MNYEQAAQNIKEQLGLYDHYDECGKSLPSKMPFDTESVRTLLQGYEAAVKLIDKLISQYSECHLCSAGCHDDEDVDRCKKNAKWRGPAPGSEAKDEQV